MDVALVSCRTLPEPDPDAAPLAAALDAAGIRAEVRAWDKTGAGWPKVPLTILRSSWNYPLHHEDFLAWAGKVAAVSDLWNPLPVVRWNAHKSYLLDLESRGLPVTPTALLPRGSRRCLAELMTERGWRDVVVKPAVSASSYRTQRVGDGNLEVGESHLAGLLADRDTLVQPYLEAVDDYGERALVWIDGKVTHAIRKTPRFSGQEEAVSSDAVPISPAEADLAARVLATVDHPVLYARIDVAPGPDGDPVLMELEMIEPSLFFAQGPEALERFVDGVRRRLDAVV